MEFSAPIGTEEERASGKIWPGRWHDANPYLSHYSFGYHTGADLNLNFPHYNMNAHAEVYAICEGKVTFARLFSPTAWGNLVVIDHGIVDGLPLFSRYGHVEDIRVEEGQAVQAGEMIAAVGNGGALNFPYHLHFDISRTEILGTRPGHWPGEQKAQILAHYVDPKEFLQAQVSGDTANSFIAGNLPEGQIYFVIATLGLNVRKDHMMTAEKVGVLAFGKRVYIDDSQRIDQDSFTWGKISDGQFTGDWMALGKADNSQKFVSRNPPG
jgi:hypothetical protein